MTPTSVVTLAAARAWHPDLARRLSRRVSRCSAHLFSLGEAKNPAAKLLRRRLRVREIEGVTLLRGEHCCLVRTSVGQ
jgi:hypothetical protein